MMLGIFLSILAMIFTVYIPTWAKTGEANHMESVESSFLDLKSTIEAQIADEDGVGTTRSTRIKLGAEGGAVLGIGRTSGSLDFTNFGFNFEIYNTNDTTDIYGRSYGKIFFRSDNIYFENQYFTYENGAVIVEQEGKTVLRAKPDFNIKYDELTGKTTIVITQIQLTGEGENLGGTNYHTIDTKLVQSIGESHKLIWTESKGFPNGQNLTFNITTKFGNIWQDFLNDELENFPTSVRTNKTQLNVTQFKDPITNENMYAFILKIDEIHVLDIKKGIVEVDLN
jgi:hypothetical protein